MVERSDGAIEEQQRERLEAEHAVEDDAPADAAAADLVIFSTADEIERVLGGTVGVG